MSTTFAVPAASILGQMQHLLGRTPTGPTQEPPQPQATQFIREMEPQIRRVVRRAMHKDPGTSNMNRQIHAVASKLGGHCWQQQPGDREMLVCRVARAICHSLVQRWETA